MLRLISVNPTGVCSFGMHEDVPLDSQGLVWLRGENGVGKSTFFNVISLCLFNRIESFSSGGSVKLTDELINEVLGTGMCPRVEWLNKEGQRWRVTYSRKWKGESPYENDSDCYPFAGTDIYLEQWVNGEWLDQRADTMPKTQVKVGEAVGVSYDRYLVTTYLAQGRGMDFFRGTHSARMKIFTDVVNLRLWDSAALEFKERAKTAEAKALDCRLRLTGLEGHRSGLQLLTAEQRQEWERSHQEAEAKLAHAQALKASKQSLLEAIVKSLGSIQLEANPFQELLRKLELSLVEWNHKAVQLRQQNELKAQSARQEYQEKVRLVQVVPPELQKLSEDVGVARKEKEAAQARLDAYKEGKLTHCPVCKRPFGKQKKEEDAANIKHLEDELVAACASEVTAGEALTAARTQRELAEIAQLESLQQAFEQAKKERELTLQGALDQVQLASQLCTLEREKLQKQFDAFEQQMQERKAQLVTRQEQRAQFQVELTRAEQEVATATSLLQQAKSALDYDDRARVRLAALEQEIEACRQEHVATQTEVSEWQCLQKLCGDKAIKAWKIEEAVERLNVLLAEALAELDGAFQLWVKPYYIKPGALGKPESQLGPDDVVHECTVYVREGGKSVVPLCLYSGGETSLLALALMVAFWYLSDEYGDGSNLLLLDEAVAAYDARNSQIVTKFLEWLKNSGKTVIIVSHSQVVDTVDFDQRWQVLKQDGVARLRREA